MLCTVYVRAIQISGYRDDVTILSPTKNPSYLMATGVIVGGWERLADTALTTEANILWG